MLWSEGTNSARALRCEFAGHVGEVCVQWG